MIAQCTLRATPGHRQVRQDKCRELVFGQIGQGAASLQALVQVSSSGDGRICSVVMFARESDESKHHKSLGRLTKPAASYVLTSSRSVDL